MKGAPHLKVRGLRLSRRDATFHERVARPERLFTVDRGESLA